MIRTRGLEKSYGSVQALRGVSIEVQKGEVFGLLGQNGAGKSTLIKILLGIVKHTDGDAELLGESAGRSDIRKRVGYLPEDHQFPLYHSAHSLLDFYGQLYGVSRSDRLKRIPEVLEIVGIAKRMHSKIRTYSKGMKQRLGIAQSIFHHPDVIFLDEPTDGVDPVGRREIRDLMQELKGQGKTVFVNSHLLGEVELICDRVAILQRGELARLGTVAELTRQEGRYVIGLAGDTPFPTEAITRMGYRVEPEGAMHAVIVGDPTNIDSVLSMLHTQGLKLRHLVEQKQTLEDVFVNMVDSAEPGIDSRRKPTRSVGGDDGYTSRGGKRR
ncbi:MAG: ATP-binding cassette domain-containing protein [Gemmataceae bacterium]